MTVQVADIASERVTPGLVLFQGDVTILAEHVGEITKRNTLAFLISFVGRISDALYLPEVTELVENLCFCVAHDCFPLTLIEYRRTGRNQPMVDTLTNWHSISKMPSADDLQ